MERLRTNIVPPYGPLDAKICAIGQAPGEEEDNAPDQGPFIGSAGMFMTRVMRQVGVIRSELLLNNVFSQRPPKNDVGYFFEDSIYHGMKKNMNTRLTWEGREHVEVLRHWLEGLRPRPNLLVALGREAMLILTGKKRIWKWRGSVLPCTLVEGYKVYCTFHPSGVLRLLNEPRERLQGEKKQMANNALPLFLRDWERIKYQGEFPELRYPKRSFDTDLSYDELIEKLSWLIREEKDSAVDIETLYGPEGPILWCIGFAPSPAYAFTVPFIRKGNFAWPIQREAQLLDLISQYFLCKAKKIFQFGNYDMSVLGRLYGLRVAKGTYEDTCWAHHTSFPQIKKSLEILNSIYTWEPYFKDEGKVNYGKRSGDAAEFTYNSKDCCTTKEIFPIVRENAQTMGTWRGYLRSMTYMPSLFSMMIRGVKIDVKKRAELEVLFKEKAEAAQNYVSQLEGEYINLNSSQQVIALLYYKHMFKEKKNRKTGKPTADKDAMSKLAREYPNEPVIKAIQEFKKFDKLYRTFAKMELDIDGRMHTSYGFVSTWRLSSSTSPFGSGGNLQNIPVRTEEGKEIRRLFIPDDMEPYTEDRWREVVGLVKKVCGDKVASTLVNGQKLFLASDLSQAEARVVAWEAEDLRRIKLFRAGNIDVHWVNAQDIFGIPPSIEYQKHDAEFTDSITNEPHSHWLIRQCAKNIRHGTNYCLGPMELQSILARDGFIFPYSICKELLRRCLSNDPDLRRWQEGVREKVKSQRFLVSSFGRKRYFYGRLDDNTYRAAIAFSPQNTVGELLQEAIQEIEDDCPWIENLLNVHDEVVTQIEPNTIVESIQSIKKAMERKLVIHERELIIPCDFKAGPSWGDLSEFEPNI